MSHTATAILQTPWDCKWSRFGHVHASRRAPAEGLWVCVYPDGTRRPIEISECAQCSHFEYESPFFVPTERRQAQTAAETPVVAACAYPSRAERRLEMAIRVAALALAVIFAAIGFVVLTGPLAIPLTISLWIGALTCFLLGVWGHFNRRSLPVHSW